MYKLELTAEEVRTLAAMGHKGYDCGICDALDAESVTYQTCVDGLEIYTIPEHIIWPVYERYSDMIIRGNDPWGPFVAETLRPKLHALMESVV